MSQTFQQTLSSCNYKDCRVSRGPDYPRTAEWGQWCVLRSRLVLLPSASLLEKLCSSTFLHHLPRQTCVLHNFCQHLWRAGWLLDCSSDICTGLSCAVSEDSEMWPLRIVTQAEEAGRNLLCKRSRHSALEVGGTHISWSRHTQRMGGGGTHVRWCIHTQRMGGGGTHVRWYIHTQHMGGGGTHVS